MLGRTANPAGTELDLAKAYDSVFHGPAAEALRFEGTPLVLKRRKDDANL